MRTRITRIAPLQSGKVSAVLYGLISLPFVALFLIASALAPGGMGFSAMFAVAMPFFYIVFGFLFTALAAWLYNVVAGWTGGIEFETESLPDEDTPAAS